MELNLISTVIGALIGGVFTLVSTLVTIYFTKHLEEKRERRQEEKEAYRKRPELKVMSHNNTFDERERTVMPAADLEVYVAAIKGIKVDGCDVFAQYDEENFDKHNWRCATYTLKNVGETAISHLNVLCCYQKDTCNFAAKIAEVYMQNELLNYTCCLDKKIRAGEEFTLRFWYHKDRIITGQFSPINVLLMVDDNGRFWEQPLFAPKNQVGDSRQISSKDYFEFISTDKAYENFLKPYLW